MQCCGESECDALYAESLPKIDVKFIVTDISMTFDAVQSVYYPVPSSGYARGTISCSETFLKNDGLHIYSTGNDVASTGTYTEKAMMSVSPGQCCPEDDYCNYGGTAPVTTYCSVTRSYEVSNLHITAIKLVYGDKIVTISGNNSYYQNVYDSQLKGIAQTSTRAQYIQTSSSCNQAPTGGWVDSSSPSYSPSCSNQFVGGTIGYQTVCSGHSLGSVLSLGNKIIYPDAVYVDFTFKGAQYKDHVTFRQFHF